MASNDKKRDFALASFENEQGSMFVVPTCWLDGSANGKILSSTVCYWPPYVTDAKVNKAAMNKEAVKENWRSHYIRVLCLAGLLKTRVYKQQEYATLYIALWRLLFYFHIHISLMSLHFYSKFTITN